MVDRLLADEEVHELKLGQSFESGAKVAYHSMFCECCIVEQHLITKTSACMFLGETRLLFALLE